MDYSKIVFTLELSDEGANRQANDYLKKGWVLLSVGTKRTDVSNGQLYYSTVYVLGANEDRYEEYLTEDKPSLI